MADRIARVWNGTSWEIITSTAAAPTAVALYQASATSASVSGQLWIDSDNNTLYFSNGSSWIEANEKLDSFFLLGT